MHAERIEAVIIFEIILHIGRTDITDCARNQADKQSPDRIHKARSGCDADKTGHQSRHHTQKRWLFAFNPFRNDPAHSPCHSGDDGVEHGHTGE